MTTIENNLVSGGKEGANHTSTLTAEKIRTSHFRIHVEVQLSKDRTGTITIENHVDALHIIMPFVGHEYQQVPHDNFSKLSKETMGSQEWTFKAEQINDFINFLRQAIPFKHELPWGDWSSFTTEGIADNEDEDDFLPQPRLQITHNDYEEDDRGNKLVAETHEMYLPFTPENRSAILTAIEQELNQQEQLIENPAGMMRRVVNRLLRGRDNLEKTRSQAMQRHADYFLGMLLNSGTTQEKLRTEYPNIELAIDRVESGDALSKFSAEELRAKLIAIRGF